MKSLEQKAKQKVVKCGWGAGSCTLSALGSKCVSGCCKRLSSRWRSHSVLTQGSNFARCPNQKQINQDSKTICRSQLVTRRSHNGQVEVPCTEWEKKRKKLRKLHKDMHCSFPCICFIFLLIAQQARLHIQRWNGNDWCKGGIFVNC